MESGYVGSSERAESRPTPWSGSASSSSVPVLRALAKTWRPGAERHPLRGSRTATLRVVLGPPLEHEPFRVHASPQRCAGRRGPFQCEAVRSPPREMRPGGRGTAARTTTAHVLGTFMRETWRRDNLGRWTP